MSKKIDTIAPNQLSIFDLIKHLSEAQKPSHDTGAVEGSLDLDVQLRELISRTLKHSKHDRYGVAATMSRLMAKEITKSMLDSWSAESKDSNRFPLSHLSSLITATEDKSILRFLCEKAGGYFIESEDALRLELGKLEEQEKEIQDKRKAITEFLHNHK